LTAGKPTLYYVNANGVAVSHEYERIDLSAGQNLDIVFDLSPATLTDGCIGLLSLTCDNSQSHLTINFGDVYLDNGRRYAATLSGAYVADDSYVMEYTSDEACTSLDLTKVTELPSTLPWLTGTNRVAFVDEGSVLAEIPNVVAGTNSQSLVLKADNGDFRPSKAFSANKASLACTVNGLRMLMLPFEAAVPQGVQVYTINDDRTLLPVASIAAHQPVLVSGNGVFTFVGTGEVSYATSPLNANYRGTYTKIPLYAGDYVLGYEQGAWGFARLSEGGVLMPFDVYAQFPDNSQTFLPLDLTNTGIRDVVGHATTSSDVYNVMGQRVTSAKKGMIIQNGKILIKR
jgi:glucuronoarabinoxylan endo-1,4-beta-xylanase